MRLTWSLLPEPLVWIDGGVRILVIENRPLLRSFLRAVRHQTEGMDGELVVSAGNRSLEFSKTVELLTDPFSLPFSSKKLAAHLTQAAAEVGEEYGDELSRLVIQFNDLAGKICTGMEYNVTYNELEGSDAIFKLMGFHPDGPAHGQTRR